MSSKKKTKISEQNKKNDDKTEIKEIFDSALEEDLSEMSELTDVNDAEAPEAPAKKSDKTKSRINFILGLIILILAVIGGISSFRYISDRIDMVVDNTEQKNEFARFIYPVVICDPAPFDENIKLRNETVISAAIWDIILYEDKSKYTAEFDNILVPEVDIEQHAAKLFGTGLVISHTSIGSTEVPFYYDPTINSYRIPSNPKYFTYSPMIDSIEKSNDSYVLTVGYISPTPAWLTLEEEETPSPDKYVVYTVKVSSSGYTLTSIKPSDKQPESNMENGL